jgi:hypothetical protein
MGRICLKGHCGKHLSKIENITSIVQYLGCTNNKID